MKPTSTTTMVHHKTHPQPLYDVLKNVQNIIFVKMQCLIYFYFVNFQHVISLNNPEIHKESLYLCEWKF